MSEHFAADCHAHVFSRKYPFGKDPPYVPHASEMGTVEEFASVLEAHRFTHGLLVGAAPYGADNRCLLDAIANSGGRFKGIGLASPVISERELAALADGGLIGLRVTMLRNGMKPLTAPGMPNLLARMKEMCWFLEIQCEHDDLAMAAPLLRKAGVRLIVDHFGRPDVRRGVDQPGFAALLEFGRSGDAIVKLSGPFRSSIAGYPFEDTDPFVAAAIDAFTPERCVWGSDWPYVLTGRRMDYGPPLRCLSRWLSSEADRRKVLWDTPARVFGFR